MAGTGLAEIDQRNHVRHLHDAVDQAGSHRGGSAKRLVDAAEVVEHKVERQRVAMVVKLLAERIGEAGKRRIDMRMVGSGDE